MSAPPENPPEAELIKSRREAALPPLSRRQAAAKAGISPSQRGDVERGWKNAGSGVIVPVQTSAATLARMATAIGASADELATAGRADAARELRDNDRVLQLRRRFSAIPGLGSLETSRMASPDGQELLSLIGDGLDAIDRSNLPEAAKRDLTRMYVDGLISDATRRHSELVLVIRLASEGG